MRRAWEDAVNGRVLIIDHGEGVSTAYCHNSRVRLKAGDHVDAGEVIASSGTTGRSTGPHLHYQLELFGRPTDPLAFRAAGRAALRATRPAVSPALRDAFRRAATQPVER